MSYETILLDKKEGIATITLNRPDRLNAISRQMQEDLASALGDVGADDDVRVLVLTGAGRAFCAGADVGGMGGERREREGAEAIRRGFRGAQAVILGLHRLEKPTIASVNGTAVGGGFDMACACDLRIGSENARFMSAFVRIGLFPGWGGTWLYAKVLGVPKAAELLFTGDFLEAAEAKELGMLNKLVPAEKLQEETLALARKIADGPPISIRLSKMQLYKGLQMDLETAMQFAAACETITLSSEDHREGITAFREKRKARFVGR